MHIVTTNEVFYPVPIGILSRCFVFIHIFKQNQETVAMQDSPRTISFDMARERMLLDGSGFYFYFFFVCVRSNS